MRFLFLTYPLSSRSVYSDDYSKISSYFGNWNEFTSLCCAQTQSSTPSDRTFSNNLKSYDSFPYGRFTWVLMYPELPCQEGLASRLTCLVRVCSLRHLPHYIQLAVTILLPEFTTQLCLAKWHVLSFSPTQISLAFSGTASQIWSSYQDPTDRLGTYTAIQRNT